ncbi:response regulator [Owenweeksia hongkongensis]|uniref:response regulator n=1 Tax=Owenweeksia hongkongensis TaxID=253245 RepID=UPI003A918537
MSLSIMIVDNDQVNSFVLKNIITRNYGDADISMFPDGSDAIEHLAKLVEMKEDFPDVILLDIYMPIMNGFEFLERYTKVYSHKPTNVFAMSNSLSKEDQQQANEYSVVKGFITKPLIYNNIQFIIETYVEGKTSETDI